MATAERTLTVEVRVVAELPWVWEHRCGHLQRGQHSDGDACGGCRFEARSSEVRQFLLVSTEDTTDGET
jgi:hypothetical protein